MSYKIKLAKSTAERIKEQLRGLPYGLDPAYAEFRGAIKKLGEDISLGGPILSGPFKGRMGHTFRIERLPAVFSFTVVYEFSADETSIYIVGFDSGPHRSDPQAC